MRPQLLAFTTILLGFAACGDDGSSTTPDGMQLDAPSDSGPVRTYYLSSTGAQLSPTAGIALGDANLADDVDAISVHQDFYGIPWDAFLANTEPPAAWVAVIDSLAQRAQGKPVFLSLTPLAGDRRHLAPKVVAQGGGGYTTVENWSADCYDFATATDGAALKQAYGRYVDFMVRKFDPKWVNTAIEINLFMVCGDSAWAGLVDVSNHAYDVTKAIDPAYVVFPSIQIDHLYGVSDNACAPNQSQTQCFDEHYAKLANLDRDRFAISTYPYMKYATPSLLPTDWFTRGSSRGSEKLVIAETGWLAHNLVARLDTQCVTALEQDANEQAAYFDRLLADAKAANAELVTWWSNRDVVVEPLMTDCPCDFDAQWCAMVDVFRQAYGTDPMSQFYGEALLKIFGTMGIRTYDGTPRQPILERWQAARADPLP
jgi:hypothetical protein